MAVISKKNTVKYYEATFIICPVCHIEKLCRMFELGFSVWGGRARYIFVYYYFIIYRFFFSSSEIFLPLGILRPVRPHRWHRPHYASYWLHCVSKCTNNSCHNLYPVKNSLFSVSEKASTFTVIELCFNS